MRIACSLSIRESGVVRKQRGCQKQSVGNADEERETLRR